MLKKINFVNMKRKKIVVTFLLTIFLISFISAWGIASSYWEGKPFLISPGETAVVDLRLQNLGTTEDVTVRAELKRGFEIASFDTKIYTIKAETKDTVVPITITIPLNESFVGKEYVVTVSFTTTDSDRGGISLGVSIDKSFDVVVRGEPKEEEKINIMLIVISLLVIAILILIYIFRKKIFKKNSSRKK